MKHLITEQDIRQGTISGTITVTPQVIITPAALDAAYARGLKVVFTDDRTEGGSAPAVASAAGSACACAPTSGASPGTGALRVVVPAAPGRVYVIHVTPQGAQVFEPKGDGLARLGTLTV